MLQANTDTLSEFKLKAKYSEFLSLNFGKYQINQITAALGLALIVCQLLDGILTWIGVGHFGVALEANPLLRSFIEELGLLPALVLFKSSAILIIISLCYIENWVSWINHALKALIAIYFFAAILPWGYILLARTI